MAKVNIANYGTEVSVPMRGGRGKIVLANARNMDEAEFVARAVDILISNIRRGNFDPFEGMPASKYPPYGNPTGRSMKS